jgi:hypothetical protein
MICPVMVGSKSLFFWDHETEAEAEKAIRRAKQKILDMKADKLGLFEATVTITR